VRVTDPGARPVWENGGAIIRRPKNVRRAKEELDSMKTHALVTLLVAMLLVLLCGAISLAEEAQGPPTIEVHGWAQTRYYVNSTVDATREESGELTNVEKKSHLEYERLDLNATARLPEGKVAYAEVYIHPWLSHSDPSWLYLESLYLDVPAGPGAKFRIGKGRNQAFGIVPSYGIRKTTNYSPVQEAFTQDRALGIQYMQKNGRDSINFGIFNAMRVGARLIGMTADGQTDLGSQANTTVAHLCDRDTPADRPGNLEFSARLARQFGPTNIGVSGRIGRMDATDQAYLASKFATYEGLETRTRYGLDATFAKMPFYGALEWYAGNTGGIGQTGWSILLGLEPTSQCSAPWEDLSGACKGLFLRYGQLDIDVPETSSSITWDTQQLALSYVYPLRLGNHKLSPKWLQIEFERNTEDAPEGYEDIPNNVFMVELFTAF
jgi:hypothetical protein